MVCKLKELLLKDVKSENETKKVAVIIRLNALFMCVYSVCLTFIFSVTGNMRSNVFTILCFFIYLFICYITYLDKTKTAAIMMQLAMIIWIVYFIRMFGWDCGVQHFIFVMLVLDFITFYSGIKLKIVMGLAAFLFRLSLYIYTNVNAPLLQLPESISIAFQIINSLFIFLSLTTTLIIFTEDSQDMEKKLVVYNEKLHRLASIDPLTGLMNRRSMQEYLDRKEEECKAGQIDCLSVAIGDIDFFKKVNDTYSHECGDIVLKQLSCLFGETIGEKGKISRWGGEEFLFVFANLNGDEALILLNEVQRSLFRKQISYNKDIIKVTMTFGLSEFDFQRGMDCTIHDADEKLYRGKETGRNKIVY